MALLVENTPQTAIQGRYLQDALASLGYKFAFVDTSLQPTDPTFNGDVQKMKAAGVQGLVFEATASICGQLAASLYQAGVKLTLGDYVIAAYDPAFIQTAGPGAAGTVLEGALSMFQGEDAAAVPMVATFDQWYSRVNPGSSPDLFSAEGWLSGLLFAQGMNAGGAATRAALLNGLKQITSFNGDGMQATSNPAGKVPPACWLLIDVQNNRFVRDSATPSGFRCSPATTTTRTPSGR
jgi:ABC-type branched-subunit amino acid transport system substrate-binding protein